MMINILKRRFQRELDRYGSSVYLLCGGKVCHTKAIVQRHNTRGFTKYNSMVDAVDTPIGFRTKDARIAFLRYDERFFGDDVAGKELRILYHGKSYVCIFDNVVDIGDEPFYVHVIMEPLITGDDTDLDDLGGGAA